MTNLTHQNQRIMNAFEEGVVNGIIYMLKKQGKDLKSELPKHLRGYGLKEEEIEYWKGRLKDTIFKDGCK